MSFFIWAEVKYFENSNFENLNNWSYNQNFCRIFCWIWFLLRARALLGDCYKLADEPRGVFVRILSLHSLSDWWEERESGQGGPPQQLTTLFLKNTGQVVYPDYNIVRQRHIFRDREDLVMFEDACAVESAVAEAADAKDYGLAVSVAEETAVIKFPGLFIGQSFASILAVLHFIVGFKENSSFVFYQT